LAWKPSEVQAHRVGAVAPRRHRLGRASRRETISREIVFVQIRQVQIHALASFASSSMA
jgi:hypothetical protein